MSLEKTYANKNVSYYLHSRPEILPYVPAHIKTALDIGCGSGNFAKLLKDTRNCIVHGIEPHFNSAEEAKSKLDYVYNIPFDLNAVKCIEQRFDCIFFNDVLEHLIAPEEALQLAKTLLTPEGCVIATIPNIRWYPVMLSLIRHKDFKYTESGVMDKTHLRFFTPKSMQRLFENCGYEIDLIEGINKHHFRYLKIANFICLNSLKDMYYPQYAIRARSKQMKIK